MLSSGTTIRGGEKLPLTVESWQQLRLSQTIKNIILEHGTQKIVTYYQNDQFPIQVTFFTQLLRKQYVDILVAENFASSVSRELRLEYITFTKMFRKKGFVPCLLAFKIPLYSQRQQPKLNRAHKFFFHESSLNVRLALSPRKPPHPPQQ
jgi:hypothetical protein